MPQYSSLWFMVTLCSWYLIYDHQNLSSVTFDDFWLQDCDSINIYVFLFLFSVTPRIMEIFVSSVQNSFTKTIDLSLSLFINKYLFYTLKLYKLIFSRTKMSKVNNLLWSGVSWYPPIKKFEIPAKNCSSKSLEIISWWTTRFLNI